MAPDAGLRDRVDYAVPSNHVVPSSSSPVQMASPRLCVPRERLEGIKECYNRTGKTWQQRGGKDMVKNNFPDYLSRSILTTE